MGKTKNAPPPELPTNLSLSSLYAGDELANRSFDLPYESAHLEV